MAEARGVFTWLSSPCVPTFPDVSAYFSTPQTETRSFRMSLQTDVTLYFSCYVGPADMYLLGELPCWSEPVSCIHVSSTVILTHTRVAFDCYTFYSTTWRSPITLRFTGSRFENPPHKARIELGSFRLPYLLRKHMGNNNPGIYIACATVGKPTQWSLDRTKGKAPPIYNSPR